MDPFFLRLLLEAELEKMPGVNSAADAGDRTHHLALRARAPVDGCGVRSDVT